MFDFTRFQNAAASAVAALIFAGVTIGAAVGPAHALQQAPIQVAAATVQASANV